MFALFLALPVFAGGGNCSRGANPAVEVALTAGELVVGEAPADTFDLKVQWYLYDGLGEQTWEEVVSLDEAQEGLTADLSLSRVEANLSLGLRARLTARNEDGGHLGSVATGQEVVAVDDLGVITAVEPRRATDEELARYMPPGVSGGMSFGVVPHRGGAVAPVEPYDLSDRELDVPGVPVVDNNIDRVVVGEGTP
jgi:hypothetical protein